MASYPVGNVVHLTAIFTSSGTNTDPTTVTLYIKAPNGGILTLTWAAGQVTRDGVGLFHYDYTVPSSGAYAYRWEATGAVIAASESTFTGGPSQFK